METKHFTHLPQPLTLAYPKTEALVTGCGGPGRTEAARSQRLTYIARLARSWGMGAVDPREGVQDLGDGLQPETGIQGASQPPSPATVTPTPWASHSVRLALYPALGSARPG